MLKLYVSLRNYLDQSLRQDDRGATAVEYGLLVALIAVVVIVAVTALGSKLSTLFNSVTSSI